jgi:hypothetical protein
MYMYVKWRDHIQELLEKLRTGTQAFDFVATVCRLKQLGRSYEAFEENRKYAFCGVVHHRSAVLILQWYIDSPLTLYEQPFNPDQHRNLCIWIRTNNHLFIRNTEKYLDQLTVLENNVPCMLKKSFQGSPAANQLFNWFCFGYRVTRWVCEKNHPIFCHN